MPSSSATVRIINALIVIIFIVLTGLGAAKTHSITTARLPTPFISRILGLGLPLLQLIITLLIACGFRPTDLLAAHTASERARQRRLATIANFLLWALSFLDGVLISTSAFALDPQILECTLEKTWRGWFMAKNAGSVRAVQDRFECCGLRSTLDEAWPFPGGDRGVHACEERFGRTVACLGQWEGSARNTLVTLTAIGATSLALKVLIAVLYTVMQVDDLSFDFSFQSRRSDPARRRLLEQDERADLRYTQEGNGVQGSSEWASA